MAYEPRFSITSQLLASVEQAAALRERIQSAAVELSWMILTSEHSALGGSKTSAIEIREW